MRKIFIQTIDAVRFVYADTDSVKATVPLDFSRFNAERIRDAKRTGAFGPDSKGKLHYMGVFEQEKTYDEFRTLGAKRYAFKIGGELTITVAGVPKKKGSAEMAAKGGIEKFDFNMVFTESEKLNAVYKDKPSDVVTVMVDGHELKITRNVTLIKVDYSMAADPGYKELIRGCKRMVDSWQYTDYNEKW